MNTYYSDTRKAKEFSSIEDLAIAVAADSNRGEWYSDERGSHVYEWLADGDIDGNETVAKIAQEWDE